MMPVAINYKKERHVNHPMIQLSQEKEHDQKPLGKYGQMALNYLKEEHPNRYNQMLTEGTLMEIMHQVNKEAWDKMEVLQEEMLKKNLIPNPMDTYQTYRHREMIKIQAEEIVLKEIVHKFR